jgi:Tol biopolymer transport system component
VSATGEAEDAADADPMVITRYLYKPTASEGMTRFNDNRRVHIFIFDRVTNRVNQLTSGIYYEHSIDWSPQGDEIVFISNREPDPDRVFNYDIYAVRVANGAIRRVTDTASAEYQPTWSPDGRLIAYLGTRRSLTSSETTMEDTHVWVVDTDGRNRQELGGSLDNRQRNVRWASDGQSLYFTVQARGNVHLFQLPTSGGSPRMSVIDRGRVGAWSVADNGAVA